MPHKSSGPEEAFGIRAREILKGGTEVLGPLPSPGELETGSAQERHRTLNRLRVELYAISSIIADEAVGRSLAERDRYPPYGLVRSLFSDFGVISASPSALPQGSITDFRLLGKALIDTTVFHLDACLKQLRKSDRQWLVDRLGRLLSLFRVGAERQAQARMRDSFSFIYGGLQFGASTCVQLAEVMSRLLGSSGALGRQTKVDVMKRSIRPAYDLASLNVEDVAPAYARLQPQDAGLNTGSPGNPAGWMDPGKFQVKFSGQEPWKVVLAPDLKTEPPYGDVQQNPEPRYVTQGCPARTSPAGGRSPIGRLWEWSVDLTDTTGLL